MSSKKLEWIFELKNKVTAPVKEIIGDLGKLQSDLRKNSGGVDQVGQSINGLRDNLSRLKAGRDGAFRTDHIRKYNNMIDATESKLRKLEGLPTKSSQTNWQGLAIGLNQGLEVANKLSEALSFTSEIKQLEVDTKRMTGLVGSELDKTVSKAFKLGEVFNEDANKIMIAANAMTNQIGGSYVNNLDLLQKGFEKGANLNGDMIDQLKEYAPFVKQLGLEGQQAMAFIVKANQQGIFSDKAFDALKEGNLSVREMGKAQVEALKGIGLKVSDVAGKTTFEILQMVSKSMEGMSAQSRQLVLADIFKGAGEDAGLAFIEGIGNMDLNLENIPSVKQAGSSFKAVFADMQTTITAMVGDVAPWIDTMGSMGMTMMGLSQIMTGLNIKTTLMAAKQWVLNVAMSLNPIGLIVAGIVALIAIIAAVIIKYDEWGAALSLVLGPLGFIINLIQSFRTHWDSVVSAFKDGGILQGLKRIGQVVLDAILMPVQQLLELASKLPGVGDLAATGATKIADLRRKMDTLPTAVVVKSSNAPGAPVLQPSNPLSKPVETINPGSSVANSIVTGGKRQQIINIKIEKVLEMGDQIVNEGKESADEIVDMVIDGITRRMSGTFRTAAQ